MHVRPSYAAMAILSILALFSSGYWYINQKQDGFRPLEPLPKNQEPYAPRSVRVEARTEYASASGAYPEFDYAPVDFNKQIKAVVQQAIDEHFLMSEENQKAMRETAPEGVQESIDVFPLTVRFETPVHTSEIISVVIHIDHYSGGAHGTSSIHTFTYDVVKRKILALQDMFPGYEERLFIRLSEEARRQLSEHLATLIGTDGEPDLEFLHGGTEPIEDNFKLFTLSPQKDSVTIYFSLYQVAPYVYGEQQITVPLPVHGSEPDWLQ